MVPPLALSALTRWELLCPSIPYTRLSQGLPGAAAGAGREEKCLGSLLLTIEAGNGKEKLEMPLCKAEDTSLLAPLVQEREAR